MIRFENVTKKYEDGSIAVNNIDLHIEKGELITLIGPSGCGKTTTLKMINKLIEPTNGQIYIEDEVIQEKNSVELRRNIGYVIQQIGLLPHMTIAENIALIPKMKGWEKERYENRVDELLNLVGLSPEQYRSRYPLELSGGQQQRVGVIRALAAEPPIVLMDEPFSALDPLSREQLQDELKSLKSRIQKTIVFVTHDIDEALKLADRIVIMKDGKIEQVATPEELISAPKNQFVREFIGAERLLGKTSINAGQLFEAFATVYEEEISSTSLSSAIILSESNEVRGLYNPSKHTSDVIEEIPLVNIQDNIQFVTEQLLTSKFGICAVVNEESKFVGVVTQARLLRHYAGKDKEVLSS